MGSVEGKGEGIMYVNAQPARLRYTPGQRQQDRVYWPQEYLMVAGYLVCRIPPIPEPGPRDREQAKRDWAEGFRPMVGR